jgi:glycerophosphoryl diester phosphodiesterase
MTILVWGHRGHRHHRDPAHYPDAEHENSMATYLFALQNAMGLECDVVQSKRGTPYLAHDTDNLSDGFVFYELNKHLDENSREMFGKNYIYQSDDVEIDKLTLRDSRHQHIPKLRHLLRVMRNYPDRILDLELKGPNTVDGAVAIVEKAIERNYIKPEQVIFSSFSFPTLIELREKTGHRFRIGAIFDASHYVATPMYPEWPDFEGKPIPKDAFYIPFSVSVLKRDDIQKIVPDFFNIERGSLNMKKIEAIREAFPNAKIIVWTMGEKHPDEDPLLIETIAEYDNTGMVFAVISDFPEIVQTKLLESGMCELKPPKG